MLLLGRLPSKIFNFTRASDALGQSSCVCRSLVSNWVASANTIVASWATDGTHLAYLLLCFAKRQRLGLCKEVAEQDVVVLRVADRVVRSRKRQEVGRDELRALVQELGRRSVGS